jgi:hypothetical protein
VLRDVGSGRVDAGTGYNAWKLTPFQNLLWLRLPHQTTGVPAVPEVLVTEKLAEREPRP